MKHKLKIFTGIVIIAFIVIIGVGLWIPTRAQEHGNDGCMSHLGQIGKMFEMYAMDHGGSYPDSWQALNLAIRPAAKFFVCRKTGHRPGSTNQVDQWCDFILVTNVTKTSPGDFVVAYCKPENHKKPAGCNVLFVDGSVTWVNPEDFSNLTCNVKAHSRINERKPQPTNAPYSSPRETQGSKR